MVDIAIVGIGCRFPGGVRSASDLWQFLLNKGDGMVEIPPDRWSLERFYDPDPEVPGRMYTRRGGFLTDSLQDFDPEYFGISPREASIMDPQQRLLLEVAQEALDDAGHAGKVAGRQVGVYVGGFTADNMAARHSEPARHAISMHTPTSSTYTMLSNRISFVFDLRGPSMTIDTACSSSLVALHEAVSALQHGEIEMALVGGANAMIRPETFISMCKGHFLAPDGRCKTFDKSADGYARGEGAGIVVLRPLERALAEGDRVYAVIRATGSNQDGRTPGITVPNPDAQAELIREVTAKSGLSAAEIGYVEAHGTGTVVGDPLEMAAIGRMLGAVEGRQEALRVGSIKASIGHTEAAAGVASVIKAALTLYHRTIVPQAWLEELNPEIPFDDYRLAVPLAVEPFPESYPLPAASVNGFGYGGTNAHAILVAPPTCDTPVSATAPGKRADAARIFPVSGRNDAGARAFAKDLVAEVTALDTTEAADLLADAVWTRRLHQPCRFAVPYADREDLLTRLTELGNGGGKASVRMLPEGRRLVFVLSGMGPQWWGMARGLLTAGGTFARVAREIDEIFKPMAGWSLIEELLRDEADSKASSTRVAQTGNFLVQVGLAAELAELGIRPEAIVGHSVGEVSAAYLSGMLSLRDAITVSFHRARLQARQAGTGSMLAVGLPEEKVLARIADLQGVEIAAVNSPAGVTLAGDSEPLEKLAAQLTEEGTFNRMLRVEVPYHSHLMDPILDALREALADLAPKAPNIPLYSTVTGKLVEGKDDLWNAEYWLANVRQSVRFADAIGALVGDGFRAFLEVGPHPVLSGNVREILATRGETGSCVPTLARNQEDTQSLRTTLADLYAIGALDAAEPPGGLLGPVPQRSLPAHKFQRVHLWSEVEDLRRDRLGDTGGPVLPGFRTAASQPEWDCDITIGSLPWLHDHVVADSVLLPGAAYLDAALAAAVALTGREMPAIEDVEFISPLVVGEHEAPVLRLTVEEQTGRFVLRTRAAENSDWTLRARGRIVNAKVSPAFSVPAANPETDEALASIEGEALYERLNEAGLTYGPHFRRILRASVSGSTVTATINGQVDNNRHQAHPAVVDCALQCMAAWAAVAGVQAGGPVVPAAVRSVRQFAPIPDQVQVRVFRQTPKRGESDLVADIVLATLEGQSVLELSRVQFRPITPRQPVLTELEPLWYEAVIAPLVKAEAKEEASEGSEASETAEVAETTEVAQATEVTVAAEVPETALPEEVPALFIVSVGEASDEWATALAATSPACRKMTVTGNEPGGIADMVAPQFRNMVLETASPVTVVVCSVGHGEEGGSAGNAESFDLPLAIAGPAALAGTAIAIQEALASIEEEGGQTATVRGVVVTRNALGLQGNQAPNLAVAPLIGARRVLRNEYSALQWRLIDLDDQAETSDVVRMLGIMERSAPEADEIMLRGGTPMAQQMQRTLTQRRAGYEQTQPLVDPEVNYVIETPASKLLADLSLREEPRRAPGDGEIELRLDALELNYKDAMKAIGLLSEKELGGTYFGMEIGMSGVGVVTRVGPGTGDVQVGDTMVFGTRGMARRYVTARLDNGFFIKADSGKSPLDFGAMVPLLTAQYCVFHAGQVQPGEVVLVHGGAGGVGMALIQAAKAAGARVIATASTPERREAARQMGAEEVLDSRSINFVEEVRSLTGGHGADVIISSAPGEIIAANLEVAAEFGRVIEVGKLDVFTARPVSLTPFEKNLSFISVDIDRMTAFRPELIRKLQIEIFQMVAEGKYLPATGHLIPVSRMSEAFEMVQRSTHIGRVMLDLTEATAPVKPAVPKTAIHADASYLITGGFGAFGLATARWLAVKGARNLVLVGRSGATTPEQVDAVTALTAQGVNVVSERVDIANQAAVSELLARIGEQLPPLRGVFHTAGVVQDGPFSTLNEQAMRNVLSPKALGAVNLHRALESAGVSVDYFVLYSSVTAVTGTVPQTSYAAANTVLDSLVAYRRANGLPATSVNWGAMSGGGMAEASEEVARYLAILGLGTIDMDRACEYMDVALAWDAAQPMITDTAWDVWGRAHAPSSTVMRFEELVRSASAGNSAGNEVLAKLAALPAEERVDALTAILAEHIASVMGIPADSVDTQTPLPELGMDSLMAVELNLRITSALGVEVSALEFTRGGGLASLAARLLRRMEEAAATRSSASVAKAPQAEMASASASA